MELCTFGKNLIIKDFKFKFKSYREKDGKPGNVAQIKNNLK